MAIVTRDEVKKFLQITTSTYDDLIDAFIPQAEADFLLIRGIPFDEDSSDNIVYPENASLVASQMVGYLINTSKLPSSVLNDKTSESIGSYSYSKSGQGGGTMFKGYPTAITGKIEQKQSAK